MKFAPLWPNSLLCLLYIYTLLILLSSFWFAASAASCLPDERSILLQLKQDFSKSDLSSWLPDTDCCRNWEGVLCDVSTGHAIVLDLSHRYIQGNLSVVIFNLTSLQYLNLAYNDFSQNLIPAPGIDKLTMLTHLNLSHSNFIGQIPIGIANLTNLISLDLSYNSNLMLRKPNLRTLVSDLRNLKELLLDEVDVSENGKEWCGALSDSVPLLQVLSMKYCNLSGPIEASLSKLNSLAVIKLSENSFNSPIPDYFADFPLKDLQLSYCNITGSFPHKIFQIPTMTNLDLYSNEALLTMIPDFSLESSLESLNLDGVKISNQIPDSIGNLKNLSFLSLSECNVSGQIKSSITKLTKLETLDLYNNSLLGSIPRALFVLPNLETLVLSNNKLSGQFRLEEDSSISFSPLTNLLLRDNQLNGSIPEAIYEFSNLQSLDLRSNQFSGYIPNSIFRLSSLRELYLDSNKFSGIVDLSLFQYLSNLTSLNLSHNQLSVIENITHEQLQFPKITSFGLASCKLSKIPHLIRYHNDLVQLDLSNNMLHGVIPSWLWDKFSSYYSTSLNLSKNMFTGVENIPPCPNPLSYCRSFISIDLSYNKMKGALPLISGRVLDYSNNEFSEIPSNYTLYLNYHVETLKLSTNRLIGELPSSICEAPNLGFLDLSNNDLSGRIPSCIIGAPNQLFLNLASNKFHGIVPQNISKSCFLLVLDLSNNNLDGDLPRTLTRCINLVLLNIGNNHITGTFPFWLWELPNIQVIILRSNRLYGALELPSRSASNDSLLQNMRIIDLASNNLNGTLPPSLFKSLISMANSPSNELSTESYITSTDLTDYDIYGIDIPVINKGIQMVLEEHIASIVVVIDLSNNRFSGDIPKLISTLSALNALNLSHNALTGSITSDFKDLTDIESLDLSWNSLSGEIPQELSSLHFLSKLNLSYNNLVGRIPQFGQFLTFDNSSFKGNLGLCGAPLLEQCNAENNTTTMPTTPAGKNVAIVFLCLFIGLGFGTGIAIVTIWPIIKRAIKDRRTR